MSIAPIWPPASPMADVSRPSDPGPAHELQPEDDRELRTLRERGHSNLIIRSRAWQPTNRELFLIDGNSLAYRAFFALPETIATSTGQPTNAIFGFASMLVKILTEYGSQPTLVAWDAGMSGREEVSTEYKAGRKKAPRPALRAVAAPPSARRGVRVQQRQGRGLRG